MPSWDHQVCVCMCVHISVLCMYVHVHMCMIMSPYVLATTGCGKTTLLDLLTGRRTGKFEVYTFGGQTKLRAWNIIVLHNFRRSNQITRFIARVGLYVLDCSVH